MPRKGRVSSYKPAPGQAKKTTKDYRCKCLRWTILVRDEVGDRCLKCGLGFNPRTNKKEQISFSS